METIAFALLSAAVWSICLYIPGWFWSPWLLAEAPASNGAQPAVRLFVEIAASVLATSWVGLVLLAAGLFSVGALVTALSAVSAVGWYWSRHQRRPMYGRADVLLLACVIAMVPLFFPPYPARIGSADATGYLAAGIHAARTGTLEVSDPSVMLLDPDLRRLFFPSVAYDRGSPPYLRLEGGYILRNLDAGDVLPAFHHGIVPWVALAVETMGEGRAEWVFSVFGVLTCVAVWSAGIALGLNQPFSLLALLATAVQAPIFFYARFPMPEVPGSFFIWSAVALSGAIGQRRLLALAGLLLGCAALLRMENAFFGVAAVLALSALHATNQLLPLALGTFTLTAHAIAHAAVWRTHYWGNLTSFLLDQWEVLVLVFTAFLAGYGLGSGSRASEGLFRWLAKLWFPGVVLGLVLLSLHLNQTEQWRLLLRWCGPLFVVGGLIGLAVATTLSDKLVTHLTAWLTGLATAIFVLAPNAAPVELWVVRRAVPIAIPGLVLLALLAVAHCFGRVRTRRARVFLAFVTGAWFASSVPSFLYVLRQPYYASARSHEAVLAESLASPCIVIAHGEVAPLSLLPLLWAKRDCPVFYARNTPGWEFAELLAALPQLRRPVYLITPSDQVELTRAPVSGRWVPLLRYTFPLASPFLAPIEKYTWKEVALSIYRWAPE